MYCSDYHTHSRLSPDSDTPLEQMAQAAVDAGLDELCITDHCDLLDVHGTPVHHYDWPPAVAQYREVVPQFAPKLTLKLGLELGMAHLDPEAAKAIVSRPEVDFVLGSIHNLRPEKGARLLLRPLPRRRRLPCRAGRLLHLHGRSGGHPLL